MGDPIHFMLGYRVGFSGTADLMALFSIRTNSRWRPPPSWIISNGHISTYRQTSTRCTSKPDPTNLHQVEGWWAAFTRVETRLWPTVDHLDPPDLPRHGCNSDRGPAASGGPTVLANDRNGGRLRLNASRHDVMMMMMMTSPQQLTIYLYSAHRAVIFAIAQLSCYIFFVVGYVC